MPHSLGGQVVLGLAGARGFRDPPLELVGALSRRLVDPVGDVLLRLARELLDSLLQFACEPFRRLLAGLADLSVELLLGIFGESSRSTVEGPLERSQMALLCIGEPRGKTGPCLRLLAVDLLA